MLQEVTWADFAIFIETFFYEYDRTYEFLGYEFDLWDVVFCTGMFLLFSEFVAVVVYNWIYNR